MNPTKGYYSLIQFCPDASRAESINLGLILFCPSLGYLNAKTSSNTRRAEKLVGRGCLAREALKQAKVSIERRLQIDREAFTDIESLNKFVATRGNALQLTAPRPVKVISPEEELNRLFKELVGGSTAKTAKGNILFPELNLLFLDLQKQGRAELDYHTKLPLLEKDFTVPYAYRNGVLNLVKPQEFSQRASQKALDLAIRGSLINQHGLPGERAPRLVVVSRFEKDSDPNFVEHVDKLLTSYYVKHVTQSRLDEFTSQVAYEAHAL